MERFRREPFSERSNGSARTALVVEDDPEFAHLVSDAIATLGADWRTRRVATGSEALLLLGDARMRCDLVLVDLGLPDLDGVSVIKAAHQALPDVPIMVISVLASSRNVIAAVQAGARGYLRKGDSSLSLARGISQVLAGEYPISPSLAQHLFQLAVAQAPEVTAGPDPLSARETELLGYLGRGYTYEESAEGMGISVNTAKTLCRRIYQKLAVGTKIEAVTEARRRGWL